MKLMLVLGLLPALALGQTNLKFQNGIPGLPAPGWFVLDSPQGAPYLAGWQKEACRNDLPCMFLAAPASPPPQGFGTLLQTFDAQPYRGKKVRLRAWIKLDRKAPADHAQMLLHVGRPNSQQGFVDNMADHPITGAEWSRYEIQGEVAPDAESIRIGLLLYGAGRAWISEVEFAAANEETSGPSVDAARDAIQKQYARLDSAFVRGDTAEVRAVLLPDAQMGVGTIREPLLPAIEAEMAKGAKLTARTLVSAVRLDGDQAVAMVHREAQDPGSGGKRSVVTSHRDTWIQTDAGWRWRESIEVSYHWILPPTTADVARPVIAELKTRAVPLSSADDLAPLGAAVGNARLVALGEAAQGTREFPQWKQRIAEYLVKNKGFTLIAAAKESDVHDLLAQLHVEYAPVESIGTSTAKIVVWTDNSHARDLRTKYGPQLYALAFSFRRGEIQAIGIESGESRGLNVYTASPSPEGSGDAVLSSARLPQFFLNLSTVPYTGSLGRWLADTHLFHDLGAYWVLDDPDASLQPEELSKTYDGLLFVEEVHHGESEPRQ